MKTKLLSALILSVKLMGAEKEAAFDGEFLKSEGQRITTAAAGILSSNLMQAVAKGGFTNALEFCSLHALPLTTSAETNRNVHLRRVSLKTRNPENKPDALEESALREFQKARNGEGLLPVVQAGRDRGRYIAPIVVNNPLCLNCHGEPGKEINPETLKLIRKLYPEDKATGYKMGDVRGAWSVTFQNVGRKESGK